MAGRVVSSRLKRVKRRADILELLTVHNATVDEIAATLEMSRDKVLRDIAACERLEDQAQRTMVARMRQVHHERLEMMQRDYWAEARAGNEKAAQVVLRAMGSQSKLLGLNAPEMTEVKLGGSVELGLEALKATERQTLRAHLLHIVESDQADEPKLLEAGEVA